MKILRLTAIRCNGLPQGQIRPLRPFFRGEYLGATVQARRRWLQWGVPSEIPAAQPLGTVPPGFDGPLYLYSPEDVPLYVSRSTVSYVDTGIQNVPFDPVNPAAVRVNVVPRLRYAVEVPVPLSAPAPIQYLLRPILFLFDLLVGLSITLFKAARSLVRLIIDPNNGLFVPPDDDWDDDSDDLKDTRPNDEASDDIPAKDVEPKDDLDAEAASPEDDNPNLVS